MGSTPENGQSGDVKFIVFGGCGFIGRHLVHYLVGNSKVSTIYVIDKTPPEIAWLNSTHSAAFKDPKVKFTSANLITLQGCERAFDSIQDDDIDYVINLAAETRKGQTEPVYKDGIFKLTSNLCQFIKKRFGSRLKCYVEFSTGSLYSNEKAQHKESDKVDLWNNEVKYKLEAEKEVAKSVQNYIIIRPALVYGVGDRTGITPRLVMGAIYKHLKEVMKLPWTADVRVNTVHVEDLVKATYHLCFHGKSGEVYNIVDQGETTQGHLSTLVSEIFDVNHDFLGTTFSTIAKLDMEELIGEINDKHMGPWANLCAASGVANTPLSPYIYPDALNKRHLSLDGKKLKENAEFGEWLHPKVAKEELIRIVEDFIELNLFPKDAIAIEKPSPGNGNK